MSFWIILSWVFVLLLTAVNVIIFLKLKTASEQMLQMAFPGAKNMQDALARMQQMTQGMGAMGGRGGRGGFPGMPGGAPRGGKGNADAQLKAAMDMLQQMQKGGKR